MGNNLIKLSALFITFIGTAPAATISNLLTLDNEITSSLKYYWNFDNQSALPIDGTGTAGSAWAENFGVNLGNYGIINESNPKQTPYKQGNLGLNVDSFTISFDVANAVMNDWRTLLSVYTNGGTRDTNSLQIQQAGSNNLTIYPHLGNFGGVATAVSALALGDVHRSNSWNTITLTSNGTNLSVYLNGSKMGSTAFAATNTPITGIQFGSTLGGGRTISSANIDNIAFWNSALSDSQVSSLVIPEPSSATLFAGAGLLAIIGIRRRKKN